MAIRGIFGRQNHRRGGCNCKGYEREAKEGASLGEEKGLEFVLTKVQKRKSVRLLDIT